MRGATGPRADRPRAGDAGRGSVVILGAGLMGAQIGLEYALGGFLVTLVTRTPDSHARALQRTRKAGAILVRSRLVRPHDRAAALRRLVVTSEPDQALSEATLVIESVDEDLELKVEVLRRAARINPTATLATNTSALSVTALGEESGAPRRIVGTHYWNPPTLMPLVEVVAGRETDRVRVDAMDRLLRELGKDPIVVPDLPGFVWNRLQLALIREAVALVCQGAVTPEAIDEIARRGFGRRWSLIGPFASMAAGGANTVARVADLVYPTLADTVRGDDIRRLQLPAGGLKAATTRRDRMLARQLLEDRRDQEVGQAE